MIKRILILTLSLLTLCSFASAQPLPLTDVKTVKHHFAANPRAVKDIGDPHILKAGEEYFTFATSGPIGFNVWRSTDLETFSQEKAVRKIPWVSDSYWAPEVYEAGGRF